MIIPQLNSKHLGLTLVLHFKFDTLYLNIGFTIVHHWYIITYNKSSAVAEMGDRGQGVQVSCPGHPAHPPSSDDRNGTHTGVQPDTVSAGLLQRCVAWSSSQQYSEAAASAEHCGACVVLRAPDDHHLSHSSSSCIGSQFDNALTTSLPS